MISAEKLQLLTGALKRVDQEVSEELIMYRTMLDLIKPKLVYLDLPLFMALLSDLFPGVEQPPMPAGALRVAIEADLAENNLQVLPATASLLQLGTVHTPVLEVNSDRPKSEARRVYEHALATAWTYSSRLFLHAARFSQSWLQMSSHAVVSLARWCLSLSPKSSRSLTAKWPGMET